jgi:hypothetical protein
MKNNKLGNYIQLTNYPLEYFQPLFSEERWEEILKVVNNWINPELKDGVKYKNIAFNPETQSSFIAQDGIDKVPKYTMEYWQKQVLEKYLSQEEVKMCNSKAMNAYCEARDKRIYDSAIKVDEADYWQPVFDGDTFYYGGVDDLRDCWDYDYPLPEYVMGSTKHYTINGCDLDEMISRHFENIGEIGEDYPKIPNTPDYLQEAWNRFVDENAQEYYWVDNKTVVLLDKTLNHNAEYEATND